MKQSVLAVIFFLFLTLPGVWAQSMGTDEVIERLREVRERTKDFTADLLQEKNLVALKQKLVSKGKIRYKYPDKISVEFFSPESTQMGFDGKTLLLYYKEDKVAERYSAQSYPMIEKYLLFSQDPFQERLARWQIVEDQESFLVMEIIPKREDFPFDRARLWVFKKDWVITAMEWVEKNGDTTLLRYSNIQLNTGLTDSDFEVHLPKDTKVTDVK
jgi:outer membrane lipoprotein-sorting protein